MFGNTVVQICRFTKILTCSHVCKKVSSCHLHIVRSAFFTWRHLQSALHNSSTEASLPWTFLTGEGKEVDQFRYTKIGHVRYINILAWLRGFRVKIANFSSFFCLSIPKRDLDTKKTTPNIEVWPEGLGVMLEYWCIARGLLCQNRPQYEALGNNYRVSGVYYWEPGAEVYCIRLNFNISK